MTLDQQHWQDRLVALADKHGVVGATLAIGHGADDAVAATGVLNLRTGAPATADSVFQVGSITKVWTATLVMQLVDDGLVDIDAPVVSYLPDFRIADDELTRSVTSRHLLSHTSGIDGDFLLDTGRGDDCVETFVAAMAQQQANHAPGATMSYCNAGYTVLGRLVEVLRGQTWDAAVRERLFAPLGLVTAGTLPEEALLWGAAVGHVTAPGDATPAVAPQWGIPRSAGPAGIIHAQARGLVAFARLHLADGVAPSGTRVVSAEATRAMRDPQVEVPDRWTLGDAIGLGWLLFDWDGRRLFGHDGSTIGQSAYLRVLPSHDGERSLAVALMGNGGPVGELAHDLFTEVFDQLAGVTVRPRPEPPAEPPAVDRSRYLGRYARSNMEYTVEDAGDHLRLIARPNGILAVALGADRLECPLVPFAEDVFLTELPGVPGRPPVVFYSLPDGARFLHLGGRATPRVD